jgi:hypothetical protein
MPVSKGFPGRLGYSDQHHPPVASACAQRGVITFRVAKDDYGWTVRVGDSMATPFRSRDTAIRQANCLAAAIRDHGQTAQVVVDGP